MEDQMRSKGEERQRSRENSSERMEEQWEKRTSEIIHLNGRDVERKRWRGIKIEKEVK